MRLDTTGTLLVRHLRGEVTYFPQRSLAHDLKAAASGEQESETNTASRRRIRVCNMASVLLLVHTVGTVIVSTPACCCNFSSCSSSPLPISVCSLKLSSLMLEATNFLSTAAPRTQNRLEITGSFSNSISFSRPAIHHRLTWQPVLLSKDVRLPAAT